MGQVKTDDLIKRLKAFYFEQLREDGELFVDEMEANTTDEEFAEAVKQARDAEQKSYADWVVNTKRQWQCLTNCKTHLASWNATPTECPRTEHCSLWQGVVYWLLERWIKENDNGK